MAPSVLMSVRYTVSGSHLVGRGLFLEGAPSHRARTLVHGAVRRYHHRHRHGLPGVRGAVGAQRTGGSLHRPCRHSGSSASMRSLQAAIDCMRPHVFANARRPGRNDVRSRPRSVRRRLGGPLLRGFLLLQLGAAGCVRSGTILQRRHQPTAHPVRQRRGAAARDRLLRCAVPACSRGPHPSTWSARGIGAVAYLVVFGSIVGYSAYSFVLDRLPVSVVSIYNYINPIIAVFLGWVFVPRAFRPAGTDRDVASSFAGVALVKRYSLPPSPKPAQVSAAS